MQKHAPAATLFLCALLHATAQSPIRLPSPERQVMGSRITSQFDPKVQIQLPPSAQYVGADRWPLYNIADCELHAFVEADPQHHVQRLYWVQFEAYLPTRPDMHHDYGASRHATLGNRDFYVDTWSRAATGSIDPGSDREHIEALLRAHGYTMPAGMIYVRLVHLDHDKRKELMIIYGEDLAPTGLTPADLEPAGKARDRWPALQQALIDHAREKISLHMQDMPDEDPTPKPDRPRHATL